MGEIHGVKKMSLLAEKPVAVIEGRRTDMSLPVRHYLALDLEDGSLVNVPIPRPLYDHLVTRMGSQKGTIITNELVARSTTAAGLVRTGKPVEVSVDPTNLTEKDIGDVLKQAFAEQERRDIPPSNPPRSDSPLAPYYPKKPI